MSSTAIAEVKAASRAVVEGMASAAGYAPLGQLEWRRTTPELFAVLDIQIHKGEANRRLITVGWAIGAAQLFALLHGHEPRDPAGGGVLAGTSQQAAPELAADWIEVRASLSSQERDALHAQLRRHTNAALTQLSGFATRRQVLAFLAAARDDYDPRVNMPASRVGRLEVMAGLALLDGDPAARELIAELDVELQSPERARWREGLRRLQSAAG